MSVASNVTSAITRSVWRRRPESTARTSRSSKSCCNPAPPVAFLRRRRSCTRTRNQAARIDPANRVVQHVRVGVDSAIQANEVAFIVAPSSRIVISEVVVVLIGMRILATQQRTFLPAAPRRWHLRQQRLQRPRDRCPLATRSGVAPIQAI